MEEEVEEVEEEVENEAPEVEDKDFDPISAIAEYKDTLIDLALELSRPTYHSDLESFETYKAKTKAECLKAFDEYFGHINDGYDSIINEIEKDLKTEENGKQPMIKI